MIQFNLLPNVKLEYVKTQRSKRLLTLVSFFVSLAAVVVLLAAFAMVNVVQKKSLNDLDGDIATYSKQLKGVKDLDKILTVQNQLDTLTNLHKTKPVSSRLFSYISQVTPAQANLDQLLIDFQASTLSISGKAPSLDVVSNYTDTLKKTAFTVKESKDGKKNVFSNVVLTSFGRSSDGATFTITCAFNSAIFDSANTVTLAVPQTAEADQSIVFGEGN